MYIEESLDTTFNVGYEGGVQRPPPPREYIGKTGHMKGLNNFLGYKFHFLFFEEPI